MLKRARRASLDAEVAANAIRAGDLATGLGLKMNIDRSGTRGRAGVNTPSAALARAGIHPTHSKKSHAVGDAEDGSVGANVPTETTGTQEKEQKDPATHERRYRKKPPRKRVPGCYTGKIHLERRPLGGTPASDHWHQENNEKDQIGGPMQKTRSKERGLPAEALENPGRNVLHSAKVAPPATEQSAENECRSENKERQEAPRGEEPLTEEVVEKGLEVEGADPLPVEKVIGENVPHENNVKQDLKGHPVAR
jgi:hypothetical protein